MQALHGWRVPMLPISLISIFSPPRLCKSKHHASYFLLTQNHLLLQLHFHWLPQICCRTFHWSDKLDAFPQLHCVQFSLRLVLLRSQVRKINLRMYPLFSKCADKRWEANWDTTHDTVAKCPWSCSFRWCLEERCTTGDRAARWASVAWMTHITRICNYNT